MVAPPYASEASDPSDLNFKKKIKLCIGLWQNCSGTYHRGSLTDVLNLLVSVFLSKGL